MNNLNRFFALLSILFLTTFSYAQNNTGMIIMEAQSALAQPGESVCLEIKGSGFEDVLGMQFSVKWDPAVLEFEDVIDLNLPGMRSSDFGLRFIDEGALTFAYIVPTGQTLPDSASFFTICLKANGAAGSTSPISIVSSPTAIEFVGDIDNVAQVITNYSLLGGTVSILSDQESLEPLSLDITSDLLSNCLIDGAARIDVAAAGGQPSYTYQWTGPGGLVASGDSMTPLQEGIYLLQVTDNQGTRLNARFSVLASDLRITDTSVTPASCAGVSDGQLSVSAGGGKGSLSYQWNTGAPTTSIDGLAGGDYRVTVSDGLGCAALRELSVSNGSGVSLSPDVSTPNCGNADGSITLNATSPNGGLSYDWSDAGNGDNRSGLAPGSYAVTVTDAKGCENSESFNFDWTPFTAALTSDCGPDGNDQINYSASADAQGGTGPYDFAWSTGDQEAQVQQSNLQLPGPGSYSVTVTDAEGCTKTAGLVVEMCGNEAPVWPGDTDNDQFVSHYDLLPIGLGFSQEGPGREEASLEWKAQPAVSWGNATPTSGIDLKYADADGNGRIEAGDTAAITQHWGQSHDGGDFSPVTSPTSDDLSIFVEPATLMPGQLEALNIMLGENDGQPVTNAYGLAFRIVYDPEAVLPESVEVSFAGSWLGDPGTEILSLQHNNPDSGYIDIALTRMDHSGRDGSGAIAQLVFQTSSNVMPPNNSGAYDMPFRVEDVRLITPDEQLIGLTPLETTATLRLSTSVYNPTLETKVQLFPNPTGNLLYIKLQQLQLQRLELLLPSGQSVRHWEGQSVIDLSRFAAGVYWLKVVTDEGVLTKKVVVTR